MHPYPRKKVEPGKEISKPEQTMRSNSLKSSDFDQENQSPKSVLSALGSDTLGSSDSDTPNRSSSPISSNSDVHTSNFVAAEPKTRLLSEEDGCPPQAVLNADSALDEQSPMVRTCSFRVVIITGKALKEKNFWVDSVYILF